MRVRFFAQLSSSNSTTASPLKRFPLASAATKNHFWRKGARV